MSLIIRRVENISKKKRKSKSTIRTYRRDAFEDDASKFTVIEDFYSENFPPLRPVYRKDIFGTPIVFRITNGIDYYGDIECKVLIHCITFMKEYKNKSFEELRWEDYSCGRKEILHYEENSYLKCLSAKAVKKINYEFFDPAPKNIPVALSKQKSLLSIFKTTNSSLDELVSKKIEHLSKACRSLHSSVKSSKSFDELLDSERNLNRMYLLAKDGLGCEDFLESILCRSADEKLNIVKEKRPRSILTYVDKLSQTTNKNRSSTKSSSDICLNSRPKGNASRQESIEIMRNNLLRYFEKAEPSANMHYDLVTQNPKFYLPCAEIGFVYQNARPSSKTDESVIDIMQVFKTLYEKNETNFGKDGFYQGHGGKTTRNSEKYDDVIEWKYTCCSQFRKDYFWNKFYPYNRYDRTGRVSRAKYILAGKDVIG